MAQNEAAKQRNAVPLMVAFTAGRACNTPPFLGDFNARQEKHHGHHRDGDVTTQTNVFMLRSMPMLIGFFSETKMAHNVFLSLPVPGQAGWRP